MAVRGAALLVVFAFVSAPNGAAAGERKIAGGFELLPLVAPRAPASHAPRRASSRGQSACGCATASSFPFLRRPRRMPTRRASVAALCPSAGVALYFLPANSDRIEDAANARGEPYSALPAAFRYRTAGAPTCGCRRAGEPGLAYWRDPTLKSGDAIMTADGIVVFRGAAGGAPYGAEAFTPVDSAPLGATRRAEFSALTPAIAPDAPDGDAPTIGEARRAANAAAGEIRFVEDPAGGGG